MSVLEYRWIPPAGGAMPTFVLLHEGLGSVGLWRNFPDHLAECTGAGVFLYSRAGHGSSAAAVAAHGVDYLHHEALEVLPAALADRGIERPVLFGHSDGASIAIIHAGDGRWMPRALVLEAPHLFVEDVTVEGIGQARERYEKGRLRAKLRPWHDDVDGVFHAWADVWRDPGFRSWNIESSLPGIHCPVLIIQGEDDSYGTLAQVEAIRRQAGGPVETLVLPGCGHAPHAEAEPEVLDAVARLVARL